MTGFQQLGRLLPGGSEAAFAALRLVQRIHDVYGDVCDGDDEELQEPVPGIPAEFTVVLGSDRSHPLATVIGVDHSASVVELDSEFRTRPGSREQQCNVARRNGSSKTKLEELGLAISDPWFRHKKIERSCVIGSLGRDN